MFYSGVQDWAKIFPASKHLSVTFGADILASLPQEVLSMFLNDIIFASNGIAILSHLLTHLNPSSSENLLLDIYDLTCLDMGLGKSRINYMLCVRIISQHMQGVLMEKIIPLFSIAVLDHKRYPCVKRCYLVVDPTLVNFNFIDLRILLSSKKTRQKSLAILSSAHPDTVNLAYDSLAQSPPTGCPQSRPFQTMT